MDINAINQVLALVQDASAFKKQLETLKKEQERVQELVEAHAAVKEINVKLTAARTDREASRNMLENAQKTAEEIVTAAKTQAAELTKAAEEVRTSAARTLREAEAYKLTAVEELKEAEQKSATAEQAVKDAKAMLKNAEAEQKEVAERLAKLKSVMG